MTELSENFNAKFVQFDNDNPKVWEMFVHFTFELIARGRTRHSARDVLHRIRWETSLRTDDEVFKVNDHWSPCYARKFHKAYSQHDGFFAVRPSRADQETENEVTPRP